MKRLFLKFQAVAVALILFTACNEDVDDMADTPETFEEMESDWVRLSLMSEDKIDLMQPNTEEIHASISGNMIEDARYYTTNSGRYNIAIDRAGNTVRFFDAGIVNHVDHGHEQTARWLDLEVESAVPTHVSSSKGHSVVFNDGDGSFVHINEAQLEIPAYQPAMFALNNTVAHHGAGFRLGSGKFAITFKNNTEPGGIPQMVKYIDAGGSVIDDNGGVEVTGIHGSAVNGAFGAFGATEGVIIVDDQDNRQF